MTIWVVQANHLNRTRQDNVAEILAELGIPFVGVNVIPFSDELHYLFDEPQHKQVIPYGSTALVRRAQLRGWVGLFFDPERFTVQRWLYERGDMLNVNTAILPVADAQNLPPDDSDHWHVRPNEDLKLFAGVVMSGRELHEWLAKVDLETESGLRLDSMICIAPAQKLLAEWRWFVVGGRIVDGSMYRCHGQAKREHETDTAVIEEAQRMADKWLPHETCVMDTVLVDGGLRVIEFNCFNGSGFYDHDVREIVKTATSYVEQR